MLFFSATAFAQQTFEVGEVIGIGGSDVDGQTVNISQRIFNALTGDDTPGFVADKDMSRYYLRMMFGYVPASLGGAPNGMISLLFKILNLGILAVATTMVVYSSVFGMSASAHDGGALGSGRYSGWSVARVVTSMGLLVPTPSGYSSIQIIVMKVVVAGIVAANTMWVATIDYLAVSPAGSIAMPSPNTSDKAAELYEVGSMTEVSDSLPLAGNPVDNLDVGNLHYVDYTFPSSTGNKQKYLPYINRAILDAVNIIQPCKQLLPGITGAMVTPSFEVITGVDTQQDGDDSKNLNVFNILLQVSLSSGMQSKKIKTFEIHGLSSEYQGYLADYIRITTKALFSLQAAKGSRATEDEVAEIFASSLRSHYLNVKNTQAPVAQAAPNPSALVTQLKTYGWVLAGISYNQLFSIGTATAPPPADYFRIIMPEGASIRNFEYVVPGVSDLSQANVNKVLKTANLNVVSGSTLLEEKQSDSEVTGSAFTGVFARPKYILGAGYDVVTGEAKVTKKYTELYGAAATVSSAQGLKDSLIKPIFSAMNSKLSVNIGANMQTLNPLSGISINHLLVAEQIRVMSAAVFTAFFNDKEGGVLVWSTVSGVSPIQGLSILGSKVNKAALNYFNGSRRDLYNELTRITTATYQISIGPSVAKGAVKALEAYHHAKFMKNQKNKETKRVHQAQMASYRKMGAVSSLMTDPIMSMLEFAQAAARSIIGLYMPLGNGLGVTYFVAGIILAAYVPFIPTIMYVFAVFAWLFAVIEAMIAAPIVGIGFANPEGHEALGRSEQAIMLLLGVFLRPMLTLMGFLFSIQLANALIGLYNQIFSISLLPFIKLTFQSFLASTASQGSLPFVFMASGILVLYVYSIIVIVEQCYAIIYVVPDQILKWIGGPLDSAGSAISQAVRQASSGLATQSQNASQGMSSGSQGAMGIQTR